MQYSAELIINVDYIINHDDLFGYIEENEFKIHIALL